MSRLAHRHWPLVAALALLWLTVAGVAVKSMRQNDAKLIYALDDAWIHMAIAKNVAEHGVFGVTRHEFTAASSSLLWSLLLSGLYAAFGVDQMLPLLLNVAFATVVVVLVHFLLSCGRRPLRPLYVFVAQMFLVFGSPIPAMIFVGMEHVLHILVAIAFVALSARVLAGTPSERPADPANRKWQALLLALCPLVATARYEGMFMGFVVFCLFLCRRRFAYGVALGTLVMLPVVLFSAYSLRQGALWLPNSLLKKGNFPEVVSLRGIALFLGGTAYRRCIRNPHVFFLVVAAILGFIARYDRKRGVWEPGQLAVIIFVFTTLFHLQFSHLGEWFYRYEAYVVALGVFVVAWTLMKHLTGLPIEDRGSAIANRKSQIANGRSLVPKYAAILLLAFFPAIILAKRGGISLMETPKVMRDRYLEHYQLGQFVHRFYDDGPIVINDIGAMAFFTDAKILDIYGLGSPEPIRFARERDGYTREDVEGWARRESARVAILQVGWQKEVVAKIPATWVEVGRWEMPRNVVFPEDTVTAFYAVDPAEAERLAKSLRAYGPQLPKAIEQSGMYTEADGNE